MPEEQKVVKRVMPHSTMAEQSVIGSMLLSAESISTASEMLVSSDFYIKPLGIMFDAIIAQYEKSGETDPALLVEELLVLGLPEDIANIDYLANLAGSVPHSRHIKQYCEYVADQALLRKMIGVTEEIADACYTKQEDTNALLDISEKKIFELTKKRTTSEYVPIRDVVADAINRIEKASMTRGSITGIPTGFLDLDYKLAGLQPSDLILIAARPSMGKTAFVLNIAENVALKQNKTVAIFSLEMSEVQLVNRLLSLESNVDSKNIRTGNLSDDEWTKLLEASGTVGSSNLIIDATPGISIAEMRSKCRKYSMENKLELIIIDYLQLMSGSAKSASGGRQQEISEISRSLKALAREINVPVIALSQLSRAVEQRDNKRPILSDLRESGAIEQDADVCMFIYRDDYYNKDTTEEKGVAEIIIAKQRNGPLGTVKLAWLPDYTKFANLEHRKTNFDDE